MRRRLIEDGNLTEHGNLIEDGRLTEHGRLICRFRRLIEHWRVNAGTGGSFFRPVHAFGRRDGFPRPRL